MTILLKGGFHTEDVRLDRIPQDDPRNRDYPVRALVGDEPLRSRSWKVPVWLDQGREGACVGFAWTHEAAAYPAAVPSMTNEVARAVYRRAQQLDQWPGEDYSGTSVIAGAKVAKERGWIGEYRWAFSEEDLARALGYVGPAVLGLNWYEGMMRPDEKGFLNVTGEQVGGHAILCFSFARWMGYYRLRNSWGNSWGVNGWCKIRRRDMAILLEQRGDACIPVTRYVPKEGA